VNLFTSDAALGEAVAREGRGTVRAGLETFGALAGSAMVLELGRMANDNPPKLKSFDPQGHRIDRVELPKILVRDYDPSPLPAEAKRAVTFGMGMTERQGGTDVRANTTRAEPVDGRGAGSAYTITGHKWFLSAPMSDLFLAHLGLGRVDSGHGRATNLAHAGAASTAHSGGR
jgi:AidA-like protein